MWRFAAAGGELGLVSATVAALAALVAAAPVLAMSGGSGLLLGERWRERVLNSQEPPRSIIRQIARRPACKNASSSDWVRIDSSCSTIWLAAETSPTADAFTPCTSAASGRAGSPLKVVTPPRATSSLASSTSCGLCTSPSSLRGVPRSRRQCAARSTGHVRSRAGGCGRCVPGGRTRHRGAARPRGAAPHRGVGLACERGGAPREPVEADHAAHCRALVGTVGRQETGDPAWATSKLRSSTARSARRD